MEHVDLVIRIRFKSGTVREERGRVAEIEALFAADSARIVDYVMALDVVGNEFALWVHDDDPAWVEGQF